MEFLMFKKILLTLSLCLIPCIGQAQSFPSKPLDGFWNDAFINSLKQKIDTNRLGAANGVATTDANNMMNMPVSGDSSSSPATASGTTVARTISSHLGDTKNIKDFGINLDGKDSSTNINNAITNIKGAVVIPDGTWPSVNIIPSSASSGVVYYGNLANWPTYYNNSHNEGMRIPYFGDDVTSIGFLNDHNNGLTVNRVEGPNAKQNTSINQVWNYVANNSNGGSNSYSGHQNGTFNEILGSSNGGFNNNLSANTYNYAKKGGGNFDVSFFNKIIDFGQDWVWGEVSEYDDVSHVYCNAPDMLDPTSGSAKCQHYLKELDLNGYGKEAYDISYIVQKQSRQMFLMSFGTKEPTSWAANTTYQKHEMILQTSNNIKYEYENEGTDECVSSGTQPSFAFNETTNITDGTCTWKFMGVGRYEIGSAINVGGDLGSYLGAWLYFDGSAGAAKISNSIFDLSAVSWDENNTTHIWSRVQPNTYIDFTDDHNNINSSDHGQNRHIFGYDSSNSTLSYKVNGVTVASINDKGMPRLSTAKIIAAGTTISDATILTAGINIIVPSPTNSGVKIPADLANTGTMITVKNSSGISINIYPIDSGWSIAGHTSGTPVVLPTGTSLTVYKADPTSVGLEVEYHPVAP